MKELTTEQVRIIMTYAGRYLPKAKVTITGYDEKKGADGVLLEFDRLEVGDAELILDLTNLLQRPATLLKTELVDIAAFSKLIPYPHSYSTPIKPGL